MGEGSESINGGVIEGKILASFYFLNLKKKHFFGFQYKAWAGDLSSHKYPDLLWSTSTVLFSVFPKVLSQPTMGPGHKTDHSLLFNTKVRNEWNCTSTLPYSLIE